MKARLYYQQTPNERYDTPMDREIQRMLEAHSLKVIGGGGGSGMGDADEMCAENDFDVEGRAKHIRLAARVIENVYNRDVKLTILSGPRGAWKRLVDALRWKFVIQPQLKRQDPNPVEWLPEDEDYTGATYEEGPGDR